LTQAWHDANQGRCSSLWLLCSVLLPKPIQAEHYELILLVAYKKSLSTQQQPKNRRLSPLFDTFLVKNRRRIIAGDSKAFYFFCFDFLHIDPSNNFC
jgi:hypothetical protein